MRMADITNMRREARKLLASSRRWAAKASAERAKAKKAEMARDLPTQRMRLALADVYKSRSMLEHKRAEMLYRRRFQAIDYESPGTKKKCVRDAIKRVQRRYRSRAYRRCLMMNPATSFLQVSESRNLDLAVRESAAKLRSKIQRGKMPPASTIAHYAMQDAAHLAGCLKLGRRLRRARIRAAKKRRPPGPAELVRRWRRGTKTAKHIFDARVRKQVDRQFAAFARQFMRDYMDAHIDGSAGQISGARQFEHEQHWDSVYGPRSLYPRETGTNPEPGFEEELPKGTRDGGLVTEYLGQPKGKVVAPDTDQSLSSNA